SCVNTKFATSIRGGNRENPQQAKVRTTVLETKQCQCLSVDAYRGNWKLWVGGQHRESPYNHSTGLQPNPDHRCGLGAWSLPSRNFRTTTRSCTHRQRIMRE